MNFLSHHILPPNDPRQARRQKVVVGSLVGAILLGILLLIFTFVFNDDTFKNQLDETIATQQHTQVVAELIQEYSSGTAAANIATTVEIISTGNVTGLANYRNRTFRSQAVIEVDAAEEEARLETARVNGSTETVAVELLGQALQSGLDEVNELTSLTKDEQFKSELESIRQDITGLLNELEDGSF